MPWQLVVAGAMPGLGVESHEGSRVTINGVGKPENGELRISYHVESGTQTLSNLRKSSAHRAGRVTGATRRLPEFR